MSELGPQSQPDEAMVDLLIKQVTEGLSPAEQRALDGLDGAVASAYMREFELAAAAIALTGSGHAEPPPADLRKRVEQGARAYFAIAPTALKSGSVSRAAGAQVLPHSHGTQTGAAPAAEVGSHAAAIPMVRTDGLVRRGANMVDLQSARAAAPRTASRSATYGWFAAAACLLLALFAWQRSPSITPVAQGTPPPAVIASPVAVPVLPPTPAEARTALMANAGSLKITFGATKDQAAVGVTGDVVWDPVTQRGYLHFAGLAANDPAVHQYQLWIFDAGRDKRYPVDGGVFDIPANAADVVIPIHAALTVLKPAAFAVTIEKPGGVVVSGREHVVLLGAAS